MECDLIEMSHWMKCCLTVKDSLNRKLNEEVHSQNSVMNQCIHRDLSAGDLICGACPACVDEWHHPGK